MENQGILICGETAEEHLTVVTTELIQMGQRLNEGLREELSLVLLEKNFQAAAHEAISLGVNKVFTLGGLPGAEVSPDHAASLIFHIARQIHPSLLLFGQTDGGRDIAPRVGAKLDTSVCLDCVALDIDQETGALLQTKPVFGGNAMAVWASVDPGPQVVSMRPGSADPAVPDPSRKGDIIQIEVDIQDKDLKGRLLDTVRENILGIKLEEASVVVAGGGGIGGAEGFKPIEELAQRLHGAVGISRVPCDENWMPKSLEIGQTGHVVSPDLYIAIGISGAPQHMAGCSDSKFIVAINKDPNANIFKEADFGIVGDYREVLPAFMEKLKSYL